MGQDPAVIQSQRQYPYRMPEHRAARSRGYDRNFNAGSAPFPTAGTEVIFRSVAGKGEACGRSVALNARAAGSHLRTEVHGEPEKAVAFHCIQAAGSFISAMIEEGANGLVQLLIVFYN